MAHLSDLIDRVERLLLRHDELTRTNALLLERVPEKYLADAHHWLILHGRYVCLARMPQCGRCAVASTCDWIKALPPDARPRPGEAAPNSKALRDAGIEP